MKQFSSTISCVFLLPPLQLSSCRFRRIRGVELMACQSTSFAAADRGGGKESHQDWGGEGEKGPEIGAKKPPKTQASLTTPLPRLGQYRGGALHLQQNHANLSLAWRSQAGIPCRAIMFRDLLHSKLPNLRKKLSVSTILFKIPYISIFTEVFSGVGMYVRDDNAYMHVNNTTLLNSIS